MPSSSGLGDGYAKAARAGSRGSDGRGSDGRGSDRRGGGRGANGRGADGPGGSGRGSGGRPGNGRSGGQHSQNRSLLGGLLGGRSSGRAAPPGGRGTRDRDDRYPARRASFDAPAPDGRPWRGNDRPGPGNGRLGSGRLGSNGRGGRPEQGGASRAASRFGTGVRDFGTGVRDIRDDLRERLRRNGVGKDDWGEPGRRALPAGGRDGDWDEADGYPRRRGGGGGGDWDKPGGRAPRPKGSWWRHWSWKKVLTLVAAFFGVMAMLGAAGVAYAYSKTPIPNPQQSVFNQASKVYFTDGKTEVGQFGTTNRVILQYNQIPPMVINAVVAAEDKNFWHEGGISPSGIIRAAYYDLTSSSGSLQGGSTITQQLVRNYYEGVGTAQTLTRKIKEIFVAQKLAQVKSKQWILDQYLNTILFGRNAYGVGAAAEAWFGVSPNQLSKLTAAQAAMLAAMIQQPNGYNPDPKAGSAYTGLVFRWKYVLGQMVNMGTLSRQAEAQALKKFPTVVPPVINDWSGYRGYIMQAVLYELQNTYHYSLSQINNSGLHVVTTFNEQLMNSLYASVHAVENEMKHCSPDPLLAAAARAQTCTGLPHYVRAGALLEQVGTGDILAMYSGKNYNKTQFDNALQSRNQVGSSFKTYVLATAVKEGMNVQTSRLNGDSPLWIPPDTSPSVLAKRGAIGSQPPGPGYYQVSNDESGNNNFGPVHVQLATAASLNTAYTDLWHRVAFDAATGKHPVVDMAQAMGVDIHLSGLYGPNGMQDEAGTALGQASLTVEEQATTIATLANNGTYVAPHVIQEIIAGNTVIHARPAQRQVLTPRQAADVDWALSADTTSGGTAAGLGLTNGQTVIAKTGTTNLSQSAFFMGATPKYAMADALFVDKPGCTLPQSQQYLCSSTSALAYAPPAGLQTLFGVGGLSGYGGQFPALIWHDFMMKNFNGNSLSYFQPVNNDGLPWNLFGKLPDKKKKQQHDHGQGGGQHCQNQQQPGHCHHGGGPTPTATATASATPTATATLPGHFGGNSPAGSGGGGAGAGAVALALVVVAAPSLPVVGRLRSRRAKARRSAERPLDG